MKNLIIKIDDMSKKKCPKCGEDIFEYYSLWKCKKCGEIFLQNTGIGKSVMESIKPARLGPIKPARMMEKR
ncbi:MAG: hypothetical protein LBR75_00545 [Prevotellaceae bacterium]|nr:hypothetical protein [Prevotellaceae bacterium]